MHGENLNPNPSDSVRSSVVAKDSFRSPSAHHHAKKSSAKNNLMSKRLMLLFEDPFPIVKAVESENPPEVPTRVIEIPNCYGGCKDIPCVCAEDSIEPSVCEDDTTSWSEELRSIPSLPSMPFSDYNPSDYPVSSEDVYQDLRAFMLRKELLLKLPKVD
ncbi:uncharacterized protein LOC131024531 [Salvia miltiorrhiza]|uniref:uncharacterized protein LOC131024531 n=1 Tax=Salvia miltiorrhiza TaxID=226208 RepID=UPI0025ACC449|nr:uncharacterized protein LOC131024531 [Salvia miltiorrhiza]